MLLGYPPLFWVVFFKDCDLCEEMESLRSWLTFAIVNGYEARVVISSRAKLKVLNGLRRMSVSEYREIFPFLLTSIIVVLCDFKTVPVARALPG